jgi:hypothetical protein
MDFSNKRVTILYTLGKILNRNAAGANMLVIIYTKAHPNGGSRWFAFKNFVKYVVVKY